MAVPVAGVFWEKDGMMTCSDHVFGRRSMLLRGRRPDVQLERLMESCWSNMVGARLHIHCRSVCLVIVKKQIFRHGDVVKG